GPPPTTPTNTLSPHTSLFRYVDGDQLSVSGLTANHGALVNNNNGTWTFTPDANYNGPVSLRDRKSVG
ncbi:cadherin-like domain-containing protein, partial [Rhizobium phaseoli]|uniref:cadherin-like domain-containing protein n=1 Tax=Rhizobium phaseoli TaxID=396 RepID=UPI001436C546